MGNTKKFQFIFIPRILAILFAFYIMSFSIGIFSMDGNIFLRIGGFLIDALPSILMLIIIAITWRNPGICVWVFLVIFVLFTIIFQTYLYWKAFLLLSFPSLVISILYKIADIQQKRMA